MDEIAVAEYLIRYRGRALRVPAADIAAVEFKITDESTDLAQPSRLMLEITFKLGARPTWQREV